MRRISFAAFVAAALMMAVPSGAWAGTFFQSDPDPLVQGTTAQANFRAAAGNGPSQIFDFESFADGATLTGSEFAGQGVTLSGFAPDSNDTDVFDAFPGFTRCLTVTDDGSLQVVADSGASEAGELLTTLSRPATAVGLTHSNDSEGAEARVMKVFSPGGALIGTSDVIEENDGLTSVFVGWVGAPGEQAGSVSIENDPVEGFDAGAVCSIELRYPPGTCKGQQATITGTEQDDVLTGTEERDVIAALGGNDEVSGLGGEDLICGDAGDDTVDSGNEKDKVFGLDGRDTLRGGRARDKLVGNAAKDTLRGQGGKDTLLGKGGKDKLNGGTAKDICKGGKKDDTAKKCEVEKSI
jgi:hypothetical protein